ncbi:MAG: alpha/beta-type small acid-soluble spore protein [Eubacteriaceae bacterium]
MSRREQKSGLDQFKMECAQDLNINLKQGYNGDLSSKQAGSIGGEMVKRMVKSYEDQVKPQQ